MEASRSTKIANAYVALRKAMSKAFAGNGVLNVIVKNDAAASCSSGRLVDLSASPVESPGGSPRHSGCSRPFVLLNQGDLKWAIEARSIRETLRLSDYDGYTR